MSYYTVVCYHKIEGCTGIKHFEYKTEMDQWLISNFIEKDNSDVVVLLTFFGEIYNKHTSIDVDDNNVEIKD